MKNTIFIVAGLLSAAVLCSCDKGEKPEQEQQAYEWEPSTKGELPEEPAEISESFLPSAPSSRELSFGREGGEQIVTYSEKGWRHYPAGADGFVWYPGPYCLYHFWHKDFIKYSESFGIGGIERTEVTKAIPAAGKLIIPEGYGPREVVGGRPTLIGPPVGSPSPAPLDFNFISLYEYELSTYTNTEGSTPDWKGFSEFVTLIDGGWCTISREFTDWFEPYEGFAYENQTHMINVIDKAGEVIGKREHIAPSKGAIGKWWIPKEFTDHPPVDYPVTVRVSPNDTGEPRQFVLRTAAPPFHPTIIINQE